MVPEGWSHYRLKSLGEKGRPVVKAGPFGSALKKDSYTNDGFKVYGQEQVIAQDPYSGTYYIDKKKYDSLISCQTRPGDVLMSLVGTIGKVLVIPDDAEPGVINPRLLRISPSRKLLRSGYFKYVIQEKGTQNLLARWAQGGTMGVLNAEIVGALPLNLPSINEQDRIVKILSTWDQAIETTEKLIDNSKTQKKGLMQQLLTGKKRLPDFSGDWSEVVLKNIATILVSPVNKKSITGEQSVRLCNYTDVYYNSYITNGLDFMTATASNSEVERFTLQKSDLIITKDSETPGDIAVPALVPEELDNVVCGYHLAIIRPDSKVVDSAFLNHLFSQPKVRHYFSTRANGATRFGLTIDGIKEASFTLPGVREQQVIAKVLDTCDTELLALSTVAQQLTAEKKALMQQLLTGKRRVKVAA